jgi:hypothetical protein
MSGEMFSGSIETRDFIRLSRKGVPSTLGGEVRVRQGHGHGAIM